MKVVVVNPAEAGVTWGDVVVGRVYQLASEPKLVVLICTHEMDGSSKDTKCGVVLRTSGPYRMFQAVYSATSHRWIEVEAELKIWPKT